jgi:hypothetical protein
MSPVRVGHVPVSDTHTKVRILLHRHTGPATAIRAGTRVSVSDKAMSLCLTPDSHAEVSG